MLNRQAPYTALQGLFGTGSFFLCSKKVLRQIKFLRDGSHLDIPGLKRVTTMTFHGTESQV